MKSVQTSGIVVLYKKVRSFHRLAALKKVLVLKGFMTLVVMLPNGCMTGMIKNIIAKAPIKTPKGPKKVNTTLFAVVLGTAFPYTSDPPAAMEIVMPRIIME